MSSSKKNALDLMYKSNYLTLHDIGFITTVFRDNDNDDDMYNYYNMILQVIDDFDNIINSINEVEI